MHLNFMTMPKTPIHKNCRPIPSHDDVGLARHALHVEAIAVAVPPQPLPHFQLGFGVLAADARHAVVAVGWSEAVGHVAVKSFFSAANILFSLFLLSKITL